MGYKFSKRCTNHTLEMKIGDDTIPQVMRFMYIESIVQNDGEIEIDVSYRIQARWMK